MTWTDAVRIPADVEAPDKIISSFNARQVAILGATAALLYGTYVAIGERVPLPVFAALAVIAGVTGTLLAIGHHDGISLDRYVLAALHHHRSAKHLVSTADDIPDP